MQCCFGPDSPHTGSACSTAFHWSLSTAAQALLQGPAGQQRAAERRARGSTWLFSPCWTVPSASTTSPHCHCAARKIICSHVAGEHARCACLMQASCTRGKGVATEQPGECLMAGHLAPRQCTYAPMGLPPAQRLLNTLAGAPTKLEVASESISVP